jgi:hypothetical protein
LKQGDFASTDRGSMLPFFVGLIGLSLVLALGAAQVCASFILRESMQQAADQLALISIAKNLKSSADVEAKLQELSTRFSLAYFEIGDGQTAQIRLCGRGVGWMTVPGFSADRDICVNSAAR